MKDNFSGGVYLDIFLEKIVKRKKTVVDALVTISIILSAILLILFLTMLPFLQTLIPLLVVGVGYIAYILVRNRNIEYEYIVTNGDLDIDMIIAQRKRKRIFTGSCQDFEIIAKMTSGQYNNSYDNIKKRINAVTSMDSQDVYFLVSAKDGGEKVLVFFEPHPKMVESFKKYIPRKVFE